MLDDPLIADEIAQTVVDVEALLALLVRALDHPVRRVVDVGFHGVTLVLVLLVDALHQIAALVESVVIGVFAVHDLLHLLVQDVVFVIRALVVDQLVSQVAEAVVGVGMRLVPLVACGFRKPVQSVVSMDKVEPVLTSSAAAVLREDIALRVVAVLMGDRLARRIRRVGRNLSQ